MSRISQYRRRAVRGSSVAAWVAALCLIVSVLVAPGAALAKGVQRIVSLGPSVTEMIYALGLQDRLVGVTEWCTYPPEATKTKAVVGGIVDQSISIERVVALQPDLVLSLEQMQMATHQQLRKLGLPVVTVQPDTIDNMLSTIALIGDKTGTQQKANALVAKIRDGLAAAQAMAAQLRGDRPVPQVYYELWGEPLMTASGSTFIGELFRLAGANNIFDDAHGTYVQISAEAVLAANPQYIFAPDEHGAVTNLDLIRGRPGWATIQAVQDGRIHFVDGDLIARPSPRIAQAVVHIAQLLFGDTSQASSKGQ